MKHELHTSPVREMRPETLYRVLQLRTDIFVVEQECAYPELDGRDLEPECAIVWASDREAPSERVLATLRVLRDDDAFRIGRVAAHADARGTGLAAKLMERALELCEEREASLPIVLDAQEPLESWYAAFGFARDGATFSEDGIPHVPMRREPGV